MNLNHLRYFIEVVEEKSFTKAAENLYVSQSAISKAIHGLEKELDTNLYERDTRVFVLTNSGELLYSFAKNVVGYYDVKEKELKNQMCHSHHTLRLGLPPTAGSIYFFSMIHEFQKQNPDIQLQINDTTSKYIPDLLLEGKLDLGVVIEPFEDHRFVKKIAYETEAILVVSNVHPLSKKRKIHLGDLKEENFLQVTKDFQFRQVFEEYCKKAGFTPNVTFESNQWDMIVEMVADNQGVSVLPLPLLEKYKAKNIKTIHLVQPEFPWALTLIRPSQYPVTYSMQKFMDLL